MDKFNFSESVELPKEYYAIDKPKQYITKMIKQSAEKKGLSTRPLAEKANMKQPQLMRITTRENYTINNLLKVLDALELEIVLQPRYNK